MKKRSRAISLLLTAALTVVAVPQFGLTALAAEGTSSKGLKPAVTADVDSQKFTHKEWTGTHYNDLSGKEIHAEDMFAINREDASATIIPYQDLSSAANAVWDYNAREKSTYMQMLTGEKENWDLTVVQNQTEAQKFLDGGFMNADYKKNADDGWKVVQLPKSWTGLGFDFPIYTNTQMPWQSKYDTNVSAPAAPVNYNPVGLYRKTFTVDQKMTADNRRVYIQFEGVESAYYVYVNGKEVGYSEDSFSPHKFDVTDYLKEGENTLAVKVHKFCDGTWFEDQDMIYDGGIFRDVFLTSQPLVQISDYTVRTDLDEDYKNAELDLSVDIKNISTAVSEGYSVKVSVLDESGKSLVKDVSIPADKIESKKTGTFTLKQAVKEPKLWSAEDPNLYALVLTLVDGKGEVVETVSTQLGFREIEFTSTEVDENYKVTTTKWDPITINGKRLLLKGVNRHDSDPFYGKAVPQETTEEDIKVMQRNNINAIRTSHYSNDSYLYWLCNKYGMYMMGETNMESHALMGNNEAKGWFYELAMDRTETAYERLKNNPAIVIWSIGNEMVYTSDPNTSNGMFRDMIWYFKNNDPTRPVHSEGMDSSMGVDMGSQMYPSSDSIWGRAGEGKIPYVMCEYDHAMGNSVGALKEYWEAVRSADNMLGGFIWDWADQARAVSLETIAGKYDIKDATGVAGKSVGFEKDWITGAGEGSLNGGKAFSGYTVMDENEKYNAALSGTGKSFTFEVIVKPASSAQNSVFLAKGDTQVALKTQSSGSGLEFFVYNNNSWKNVTCNFPANWENQWHQVVGVYDKGAISIYVDGVLQKSGNVADSIAAGTHPVGVGYDALNGRTVDGQISLARIYTKALSKDEIDKQRSASPAITSADASVLLWMDYSAKHTVSDESAWDYYAQENAHKNLYAEESKGMYYAYGGDWGDTPNDNSFCQNGLVSPDRQEQPEIKEVKYQYQNFWFEADVNQLSKGEVSVYNENNFTDLSAYDISWKLLKNGLVIDEGKAADTSVKPLTEGTVKIPFDMPSKVEAGDEYYLNVSVSTKKATDMVPAGTEIAYEQIKVPVNVKQSAPEVSKKAVTVKEEENGYKVEGTDFSFVIDKTTGTMKSYTYKGEVLISEGPVPNFWRGYVENDYNSGNWNLFDRSWQNAADNIKVDSITATENADKQNVITANLTFPNGGNTKETIIYTINGDGQVTVNMSVDATASGKGNFLRVGSMMTLPEGFEDVTWYGNGPVETFNDRKTNATQGIFTSTVTDFFFPFMKVDDCGNLTDVKWISVKSDSHKSGLLVAATDKVEASTLHFTPKDLNSTDHVYGLSPRKETILSVDYGSMGTGSATCGQGTLSQYQLPSNKVYNWEYTLIPTAKAATNENLTNTAKAYGTVESFDQDSYDKERADAMIGKIDSFVAYDYSQMEEVTKLKADYNKLTDVQKALVNKDKDREKVLGELEKQVAALEGKTSYIMDQSANKLKVPYAKTAAFKNNGKNIVMSGYLDVPFNDVLSPVLEGKNSFTVEVNVTPTGSPNYNMFAGKGDNAFALRCRGTSVDFHIYAGGSWRSIEAAMPADMQASWLNNEHQVAGIYDAEANKIRLYVDGKMIADQATETTEGVAHSDFNFTIGACPDTGRTSMADFADVRIYSKALTAEELAAQNTDAPAYGTSNEAVKLWLDFDNLTAEENPPVAVDKSVLTKAIAEAEKITDASAYTEESFKNFSDTLKEAKKVLEDTPDKAPEKDVAAYEKAAKEAADKLDKAREDLEKIAKPNKKVEDVFEDIDPGDWFIPYVQYVYDHELMTGLDPTHFGPSIDLSRAHFATILYRIEGEPETTYEKRFPDVPDEQFYTNPVMWASSEEVGVINGYADKTFGPADLITREQFATMMYRYAKYKGYDTKKTSDMKDFPDTDKVSEFAGEAMSWAVAEGLITGDGGKLNPQGTASRAVCATIIMRFMENVAK